jgi:hypothetical protein
VTQHNEKRQWQERNYASVFSLVDATFGAFHQVPKPGMTESGLQADSPRDEGPFGGPRRRRNAHGATIGIVKTITAPATSVTAARAPMAMRTLGLASFEPMPANRSTEAKSTAVRT